MRPPFAQFQLLCRLGVVGLTVFSVGTVAGRPGGAAETYVFREPALARYGIAESAPLSLNGAAQDTWLPATPAGGSTNRVWLGSRVVLRVQDAADLPALLDGSPLSLARTLSSNLFILQAPNARAAAREAQRLATHPNVQISHPVRRRPARLHGGYVARPNDPLFTSQWHLENRAPTTGLALGPDLNARAAWAETRGAGILVAQGDDGMEVKHPDLAAGTAHDHHWNFISGTASGSHMSSSQAHGTAVAGLTAARDGNGLGVCGLAPQVQLAMWVVFDGSDYLADEETVGDMFGYRSNLVAVQNHSWGNASVEQLSLSAVEDLGVANAVDRGRGGLGVVMVRSAGNNRDTANDLNDDGFGQDPRTIAVGAVRQNGRVTSYSTPGAPVLVAAFSGDENTETPLGSTTNYWGVATTDRQGSLGYNATSTANRGDYAFGTTGFSGTSASAPQISGLCALILAANPTLSWRDAQQILLFAARHLDPLDPDLQINGAGFPVNHNVGFGVPNSGYAVALARRWVHRPARIQTTVANTQTTEIPDDGLRVQITGEAVPMNLVSIPAFPSDGLHPDAPTGPRGLVDVGLAPTPLSVNLTGQAALILRGGDTFSQKIASAAAAGAAFAVVYNNRGSSAREYMGGGDLHFNTIPAVFIDQSHGEALHAYLANSSNAQATLALNSVAFPFEVTTSILCEHVRLRVVFSHPRRADVRLTLVSPAGTRSVLHHFNTDTFSSLGEWSFFSTHHFYEQGAGTWRAEVSDERPGSTGRVLSMELTLFGVPIEDSDQDGLDDSWELRMLGSLSCNANQDVDQDGYSNAREQILGSDPKIAEQPMRIEVAPWDPHLYRLSWPASAQFAYELLLAPSLSAPPTLLARLSGVSPELDWVLASSSAVSGFAQVRQIPLVSLQATFAAPPQPVAHVRTPHRATEPAGSPQRGAWAVW